MSDENQTNENQSGEFKPNEEGQQVFRPVVNNEGQYSIWPTDRAVPEGWTPAGTTGTEEECASYIKEVWTDFVPDNFRNEVAMLADDEEDKTTYRVVINAEEQYSIWPADRELPLGWNDAGKTGTKQECLDYIEEVWTDMRPLSLRQKIEESMPDAPVDVEAQ